LVRAAVQTIPKQETRLYKDAELDVQPLTFPPGSVSKQQAIVPGQCYQLEDNTSSFKDFHGSRNNRFTSSEQAAKNRIQHPSNVLHFFNAQPDISPEIFNQVKKAARVSFVRCTFFIHQRLKLPLRLVFPSRPVKNWESRAPPV